MSATPAWSEEQMERYAEIIRQQSAHEDNLQNTRFSWFATLQGFLFASLAVIWKDGTIFFILVNCLLGALVAASCANAIELCSVAQANLQQWWYDNLGNYKGPARVGLYVGKKMTLSRYMRPWRIIPRVFVVAWLAIFAHKLGLFSEPSSEAVKLVRLVK